MNNDPEEMAVLAGLPEPRLLEDMIAAAERDEVALGLSDVVDGLSFLGVERGFHG